MENLSKSYTTGIFKKQQFKAVDDVTFTIAPGETLGLVGESGCGKSTLARAILRLITPSKGRVFFKGRDVAAAGTRELNKIRGKMQIIFQHPETALNPRLRIYDSITEPMRIQNVVSDRAEERERVSALLEQVGLYEEHLTRYPHELSGGQIQRVVLARILSLHPEFIVADEPTSMLDVSVQAQVLNIFKEIQQKYDISYLFISHDLEVVRWMSDCMAVMYKGRIVEIGPTEDVYQNPQHPYTTLLVDAFTSFNNGREETTEVAVMSREIEPGGCRYAPFCSAASAACDEVPELKEVTRGHYAACRYV